MHLSNGTNVSKYHMGVHLITLKNHDLYKLMGSTQYSIEDATIDRNTFRLFTLDFVKFNHLNVLKYTSIMHYVNILEEQQLRYTASSSEMVIFWFLCYFSNYLSHKRYCQPRTGKALYKKYLNGPSDISFTGLFIAESIPHKIFSQVHVLY